MIGIIVIGVIVGYILLSKFIVTKVLQSYGLKKANIVLAIMILIPTWDVILGFPVYAYLCMFESGVKIYKSVDNVEGFYVGEKSIGSEPIEPYEGYRYVDYQEVKNNKPTGKYYRSYWVDYFQNQEMANMCVYPPHPKNTNYPYTKAFKEGKCIVKEEIAEGEVVGLWKVSKKVINNYSIFYLNITSIEIAVVDPRTSEKYFTAIDWIVDNSWITAMNGVTGTKSRNYCIGVGNNREYHIDNFFITNKIIKKGN